MANAAAELEQPVRLRLVLSLAAGLLSEVLTIIAVGIVVLITRMIARGQAAEAVRDVTVRAVTVAGPTLGAVFTFVVALWVTRKARGRYMAHALLVAVGSIALHTVTALGAPGGYRAIYALGDVPKLIVAAVAAVIAGRRSSTAATA
jgi:hypothetical protein